MKNPQDMNEKELLSALLESQKKQTALQRVSSVCIFLMALTLLLVFLILVPKAVTALNQAAETMTSANAALTQLETSMQELETTVVQARASLDDIDTMVGNVNQLVVENTEDLNNVIRTINEIDFAKLNQAISDLSDVIEPLARFFRR